MRFSRRFKALELKVESQGKQLRKIKALLELLPTITSFDDWKTLRSRDKQILTALFKYNVTGAKTLQLARDIAIKKPETSGRTIVYRRLKRIQEISLRLKGAPLVVQVGRNWALNFEDFSFDLKT